MSKLPSNVRVAYSAFQRAIEAARQRAGTGQGLREVHRTLRVFLDAWQSSSERKAELERRARLVEGRTGPGSPYHEVRDAAVEAAAACIDTDDRGARFFPNPKVMLASRVLQPNEGHVLAAALRQEQDDLQDVIRESTLPDSVKKAVARWAEAAWSVESEALQLRADGCWYLAHSEDLQAAMGFAGRSSDAMKALLDSIGEAAGTLVEWLMAKKTSASPVCMITLQQAAAIVNRSKRSLERYLKDMPAPDVQGAGGKPSEWDWSKIRPWLERRFDRKLPERFPADRFR